MSSKISMKGRSLLTLLDVSDKEFTALLDLAVELKRKKKQGIRENLLAGKNIALVFEKSSTRTRCAAVVAAADEGASAEYLHPNDIHLGKKESVADTARVLGRMMDGILFRGYKQETADLLAKHAGVPVWNGLTDEWHPTQTLADLMTVREHLGGLKGLKIAYVGDGRNNVANSLMIGCAKMGVRFANCTPKELTPNRTLVKQAVNIAARNGSHIEISHNAADGVRGANAVYTDVWVSMGEEASTQERMRLLRPFQVNMKLMQATGNLKNNKAIFLHCLPAFHDKNTEFSAKCGALEVTDDVFEAPFSKVFDQAENKMHTLKALMVATLV